jgi:hypothetical protein
MHGASESAALDPWEEDFDLSLDESAELPEEPEAEAEPAPNRQ